MGMILVFYPRPPTGKGAMKLGLTVPASILLRADQVIE
jgi:hypothetical protein